MGKYKPFVYKPLTSTGYKIRESREMSKEMEKKFPIGEMVTQKYHPNNVGLVTSKPRTTRLGDGDLLTQVDVLWIASSFYNDGEVCSISCSNIKVRK